MPVSKLPAYLTLISIVTMALSACGTNNEPEHPAAYYTSLYCNTLNGEMIPTVAEMSEKYPTTNLKSVEDTIKVLHDIRREYIEDSGGISTRNCSTSAETVSKKGDKAEVIWSLSYDIFTRGKPFKSLSFKGKDSLELIDGTWTVVHSVTL